MTYNNYAQMFLGISEEDFNFILNVFKDADLDIEDFNKLGITAESDKNDVIIEIIYKLIDNNYNYLDDLEIDGNNLHVWEVCDVENLEEWRNKLENLLKNSNLTIIYNE